MTLVTFVEKEILPNLERIETLEEGYTASLMEKAGELGLLGITIPENLGGFGKDFVTGMLATERLGGAYSFAVSISAHTGIGTLPILYYGNEAQKQKYIPKLANGEWKASYCLTEPGSGSDANSGKTKAVLSEDGKQRVSQCSEPPMFDYRPHVFLENISSLFPTHCKGRYRKADYAL